MPGRQGDDERAGSQGAGHLLEEGAHVLRLHDEHESVGDLGGVDVVDDVDVVALGQLLGTVRAALGDHQLVGADAGPQQAGEQGLAHDAGAEDGDPLGHPLLVRALKNSAMLAGFSAIRRTM